MHKIFFGIMICSIVAGAAEYIFSYRVAIKNGIILNEKYYFSPAMLSANLLDKIKNPYKKCEIVHNSKSEREFLDFAKEEILECFFKWGVKLEDRSKASNYQGEFVSLLSTPAPRIKVEYERGIATIYHLVANKKEK